MLLIPGGLVHSFKVRRNVTAKKSQLDSIIDIVVVSFCINILSLLVIILLENVSGGIFFDNLLSFIQTNTPYSGIESLKIIILFQAVLAIIIGFIFSLIPNKFHWRSGSTESKIVELPALHEILYGKLKENQQSRVSIQTKEGTSIIGLYHGIDSGSSESDKFITLKNSKSYNPSSEKTYPVTFNYLAVQTKEINFLGVEILDISDILKE